MNVLSPVLQQGIVCLCAWLVATGRSVITRQSGFVAKLIAAVLTIMLAPSAVRAEAPAATGRSDEVVLEVYVRHSCPHCAAAGEFLDRLVRERPGLRIVRRSLDDDPSASDDLVRHSRAAGLWPPGVPTFVADSRVLVGFETDERTGPQIVALLEDHRAAAGDVETGLFGTISVTRLGLPLFTVALGLLDGFNPCAMWMLLFLLSLLVHLHDRLRMALVAGTFVLVSGAAYFAFMAAWLNVFLVVGVSDWLRIALAAVAIAIGAVNVKDFVAPGRGFTLSIPESAKPGLYARVRGVLKTGRLAPALAGVAALAVVANSFDLLCTAGLPAIYTSVLVQQGLDATAHYAYLGLYIAAYMADDSLMVATAVAALSSRKLTERAGAWLKLLSGAVMLALGVVMLVRPDWLS
jgi:glutaredoxin